MKKKTLPLLLYKEPTTSLRDGKNIIIFEYFNVKKYRYEVFETDQFFSSSDTVEIEMQRKKVYKALKRGFAPNLDLTEGEFKTHIIKPDKINKIADISWLDLVLCEMRSWAPTSSRSSAGLFGGVILGLETSQIMSIIALLTRKPEIADIGLTAGLFVYLCSFIILEFILKNRIEDKYDTNYNELPSDFRNYMSRIIIPLGVEAALGAFYFYKKVYTLFLM